MRVLIVLNSYEEDGPNRLMLALCGRWAPLPELSIETVALSRDGALSARFREKGIATELVPTRGRGGLRRLWSWADALRTSQRRPDLIHTNLLWPDLMMRVVKRRAGNMPLAHTIHGLHAMDEKGALAGFGYRVLERATRHRADHFVAVSNHVRGDMVQRGWDPARVTVIANGVDALQIHPISEASRARLRFLLNVPEGAPLLVVAGRLVELKGVREALAALPAVLRAHPTAALAFVGDGPLRDELGAEAERLGVAAHTRFVGHLSEMLPQVLAAADVVLQPSHTEAFGLTCAEAMAAARPVVATDIGGLRELVIDKVTGLIVPPRDPAALARAALWFLEHPAEAEIIGREARNHVTTAYEIGAAAERYLALWRRLVG